MNYLIYLVLFLSFNYAQFDWPDNGVPVRQGYHIEWFRGGDISSDGYMFVVWSDTRTSTRDVWAQKVSTSGNIIWNADGVLIAGGEGRQEDPIIISDDNGGGLISWRSYQNDMIYGDLHAQYIDYNGNLLWSEKKISGNIKMAVGSQQNMCSDRDGGVYVTWYEDSVVGDGKYYGIHLNVDGSSVGPVALINTDGLYGNVSLESAGNGDAVIVWKEGNYGDENIYAQRFKANYSTNTIDKLWNSGEPLEVCISEGSQLSPKVTYYSDDYVVVVWEDWRNPSDVSSIGSNFIKTNGELAFLSDEDADIVHTLDFASSPFPRVKATSAGAFVVWVSASDIHSVQKMKPDNINVWSTPTRLTTGQGQEQARLSADDSGGVFITWEDDNSIAIQHLSTDGDALLLRIISDTESEQFYPLVRANKDDGAFIVWADGALNYNGIGSLGFQYEYINSHSNSGLDNGPVELFYGYGGLIEKGATRSLPFDNNNNLIYWQDYRNGANTPQTYGSLVGKTEIFQESKLLSDYLYQVSPMIVRSDENTLFMGFYNGSGTVYYQRLDNSLDAIGDAATVYDSGNEQATEYSQLLLASNGNGDLYYVFHENPGDGDIFMQKYNSAGSSLWLEPIQITNHEKDDIARNLFVTDDNGAIIIHELKGYPNYSVKLTRIDSNGDIYENWNNVLISQDGERGYYENAVVTDGGIFVIWRDAAKNIFAKYVQFSISDPSNLDILTISEAGNLYTKSIDLDFNLELNEVLACWQAQTGAVYNVNCASISLNDFEVVKDIIIYDNSLHGQSNPSVKATKNSTYLVSWEDERSGNYLDLYLQEIRLGAELMINGGTVLCNAGFNQFNVNFQSIINSSNDDLHIIYWEDDRSSGKEFVTNIFAQKYDKNNLNVISTYLPNQMHLHQNFPNPFNPATTFTFEVAEADNISIMVYDIQGREVATLVNGFYYPGLYQLSWNIDIYPFNPISSGIYLYVLRSSQFKETKKLMLLK